MDDRKYKYLYQLIITCAILVIIPILYFNNVVWKKAIHEIDYFNKAYYENELDYYFGTIVNKVTRFKNHVTEFSVKSRSSQIDGGIFYHGTEKMEEKAYYYGEAVNNLAELSRELGYGNIGIYYYDKNIILDDAYKNTLEGYLSELHIPDSEKKHTLNYFSLDRFENRRVELVPLYNDDGVSTKCLLGVCTVLGKNKEKAFMFCQLEYDDFEVAGLDVYTGNSRFYVADNKTKRIVFAMDESKESCERIEAALYENGLENQTNEIQYVTKQYNDAELTLILDVSEDYMQNKVEDLYYSVQRFFAYLMILMVAVCIIVVFFNYGPLWRLLKRMEYAGGNEFEAIFKQWKQQSDLLEERRASIMDLLMNHLIYGIPISRSLMGQYGISSAHLKYCVYMIGQYVLKTVEMEELRQKVEEKFDVIFFVNDLMGEKATVCIAFMKTDIASNIHEWLVDWCHTYIGEAYELKKGFTVDSLLDIKTSFASCNSLDKKEESFDSSTGLAEVETLSEKVRTRIILNEKLKDKILTYLDETFADRDLNQQAVADHFDISVYSLSKMFNCQIGTGFVEYINGKRIEYSKKLLLSTEKKVNEIAFEVGFAGSRYFTEIFKKYTGMTPGEFRNKCK